MILRRALGDDDVRLRHGRHSSRARPQERSRSWTDHSYGPGGTRSSRRTPFRLRARPPYTSWPRSGLPAAPPPGPVGELPLGDSGLPGVQRLLHERAQALVLLELGEVLGQDLGVGEPLAPEHRAAVVDAHLEAALLDA